MRNFYCGKFLEERFLRYVMRTYMEKMAMAGSTISRRRAVQFLFGAAAGLCPTCWSVSEAMASEDGLSKGGSKKPSGGHGAGPQWGYEGSSGPENWGDLSPANRVCGVGFQQSPIDLGNAIEAKVGGIKISYRPVPLRVVNNGHTIQANCVPGSYMVLNGTRFNLLQFHFHHPSEHTMGGQGFDMEAHFVHASDDGKLAVLGVFIKQGAVNRMLSPVWDNMPLSSGPEKRMDSVIIKPYDLLPTDRAHYRYLGSLTTPPCSEKVIWSLFRSPVQASRAQIEKFASIFPMNARPTQGLNRRFLLKTM